MLHEVELAMERLDAFEDDLKAAADSGELTDKERGYAMYMAGLFSAASLCLFKLQIEFDVTSVKAKQGETQE